jgi:UDP-glucose 4-epimerase
MYRCLIIGGSGFLGSHLSDYLHKKKHQVTIFDKKKTTWIKNNKNFIKGNILDKKSLDRAINNQDYVFMFAGLSDLDEALKNPIKSIKLNILGTALVAESCVKNKVKRLIYASSIYANAEEGGFYRCSKRSAEDYILEYSKSNSLKFTILRYGSLYGPRSDNRNGLFKLLTNAIFKKKLTYYGFPHNQRKYLHIQDATRLTYQIFDKTKFENKFLNLVGNKNIKIIDLFRLIKKILNCKLKTIFLKKTIVGHYVNKPTKLKINSGINIVANSKRNFAKSIQKYINYLNDKSN